MQRDDAYLQSALDAAATRTYRMAARFGLSPADREDLQQELMLDLLEHEAQFDPTKGSVGTFTGLVSKNRSVELLDRLIKDWSRLSFGGPAAAHADSSRAGDVPDFFDADVVPIWADDRDLFSDTATLHDLETALAYLSDEQRTLFDLLEAHQDLPAACKASDVSSATFYRRVSELQMHLRMFGIKTAA